MPNDAWRNENRRGSVPRRPALLPHATPRVNIRAAALAYHGLATRDLELPTAAARKAGAAITHVGETIGIVHGFDPVHAFEITATIVDEAFADIAIVPGGFAWRRLAADRAIAYWLRSVAGRGGYVVGVSTGALVVAASGLLGEKRATGHWLALDDLEALGAVVDTEPLVRAGRVFTAAGGLPAVEAIDVVVEELRWSHHD